jgi:putative acetyltransferase
MMRITKADFCDTRVVDLLRLHHASARAQTAPGSAHALDIAGLQAPGISLWTIWDGDTLLGVGALKRLSPGHGEVKSMHTAKAARRRGAARAMLQHIISNAKETGMSRLSLETGAWDYFLPAQALYRTMGFVECGAFGDYVTDPNSVFMTLQLGEP